jgi:hypothetical protein
MCSGRIIHYFDSYLDLFASTMLKSDNFLNGSRQPIINLPETKVLNSLKIHCYSSRVAMAARYPDLHLFPVKLARTIPCQRPRPGSIWLVKRARPLPWLQNRQKYMWRGTDHGCLWPEIQLTACLDMCTILPAAYKKLPMATPLTIEQRRNPLKTNAA